VNSKLHGNFNYEKARDLYKVWEGTFNLPLSWTRERSEDWGMVTGSL